MGKLAAAKIACEGIDLSLFDLLAKCTAPSSFPARPRVAMFFSIRESFHACMLLIKADMATHAAVHVRAMIELLVHMTLLGRDEKHVDRMRLESLKGEIKFCDGIVSYPGVSQEDVSDVRKHADEIRPGLQQYKDSGVKKWVMSDLLVEAKMAHLSVPYLNFCGYSHGDLAVLALRHQGDKVMQLFASTSDEIVLTILSTAMQVMVTATEPLRDLAKFPDGLYDSEFQKMCNAWDYFLRQPEGDL